MPRIRNYTSTVDMAKSVAAIEKRLVEFGASNIAKSYLGQEVSAVTFSIVEPQTGKPMVIRLPANVSKVADKLRENRKSYLSAPQARSLQEQAGRTAWKLVHDWIDVQLSLIAMNQAQAAEVFMPYILIGGERTFYEHVAQQQFKALTYEPPGD